MAHFSYRPTGVCARKIDFEIEDNRICKVTFLGGCAGNTQGLAILLEGMTTDEAIQRLSGIRCGFKPTSCPDQVAQALRRYKEENA